ncbi:MAG: esterase-like activity of phytase family protein [Cyanobacteria bacterium]|nr:esterase-like activity of phytase family protein [Cyanobacteriota bacterium]
MATAWQAAMALPAMATPAYVNSLTIPGNTLDLSGGTSANSGRFGAFSGLYYLPSQNQWFGLSDRGPGGGTLDYKTRLQRFSLDVDKNTGVISNFQILQTILFRNGNTYLNGKAPASASVLGDSFDPEGFVVLPSSFNYLVSDEYGPSLYEFNPGGQFIRSFAVPSNVLPKSSGSTDYLASPRPGTLTSGREGNRGLEGLAVSPDGRYAFAMLQNGVITDGVSSGSTFARSLYTRILKYDVDSGNVVGQYAYQLASISQGRGISEIVALDDHRFMVIERNNRGVGVNSTLASPDKNIFMIDLNGASDVSSVDLTSPLGFGIVPVTKSSKFIDLDEITIAAFNNKSPEKWEGLAVGPRLNDGSYLLLAGTDNDYSVTQNGSNTQFDVYFNPSNGNRLQCDLDAATNCYAIDATGNTDTTNLGNLPAGYQLIPGLLQAYKVSAADLGGYTPPISPTPGPLPVLGALSALRWSRRLRRRLAMSMA